jgi:hypothetical protein
MQDLNKTNNDEQGPYNLGLFLKRAWEVTMLVITMIRLKRKARVWQDG